MTNKRKKVQITLPENLANKIKRESSIDFLSVSSWIERASLFYLNNKEDKTKMEKKIDLGI